MNTPAANGNGFRIKGWSDVLAVLGIIGILAGALAWGLKLDSGFTSHEGRISALENEASARPDPFTGSDARVLEQQIQLQIDELRQAIEQ